MSSYVNVRHAGTGASEITPPPSKNASLSKDNVTAMLHKKELKKDKYGLLYFEHLPDDYRVALKSDFLAVKMKTPYLVYSALFNIYEAHRIGHCWPQDGFWKLIEQERVFIKKRIIKNS